MASAHPVSTWHCYGRGDKTPADATKINATSKSKEDLFKKLSPFFLGPSSITPYDESPVESLTMENAWQYSKVFKRHMDKERNHTDAYVEWATKGWKSATANRFPMGRGAKPEYSLYKGRKIGYIEARHKIYAPVYETAVKTHAKDAWDALVELAQKSSVESPLWIFDFDGYDHAGNNLTLDQVIYNPRRKMGHAFVLLAMLDEQIHGVTPSWKQEYAASKIAVHSAKKRQEKATKSGSQDQGDEDSEKGEAKDSKKGEEKKQKRKGTSSRDRIAANLKKMKR